MHLPFIHVPAANDPTIAAAKWSEALAVVAGLHALEAVRIAG